MWKPMRVNVAFAPCSGNPVEKSQGFITVEQIIISQGCDSIDRRRRSVSATIDSKKYCEIAYNVQ